MRLITSQSPRYFLLILLCCLLPGADAMCQSSKDSASESSLPQALLSDLFKTEYVVDTHVNPRLWFGCCKQTAVCSGDSAWKNPICHRLSKPLDGSRLRTELGVNVVFTSVGLNTENTQQLVLPDAILNSNQLGEMPNDQALAHVYVTELDFERLSDYSAIEKWSKYQHLSGVRSIRLITSSAVNVDELDRSQVIKSLGIIFGRYFIVDVGGLTPALTELVLSYTSPRKIPVLISGVHVGDPHACGPVKKGPLFEPKHLCEIARSGGVIILGPSWGTQTAVVPQCDAVDVVNGYLFSQFEALSQLTCDGQPSVRMAQHLAVGSTVPMLEVVDRNPAPKFLGSRWGRFAQYLSKRSVPIDTMVHLLGANMVRLMRRALPGVQPAQLLFPVGHQSLTGDKGIQFQWMPPKKNDPKRIAGQIFGMRRALLVIQRRLGAGYEPWQTSKVVAGDRKSLKVKPGNFRWRLVSINRQSRVNSNWGYFSVTETEKPY